MRHHGLAFMFSLTFHQMLMAVLVVITLCQGAFEASRKDKLHIYMSMSLSQLTQIRVEG